MAKSLFTAVVLAAFVASAAAQCIECKDCKTNNCYSMCKKQCPKQVDIEKCKKIGRDYGYNIGKDACSTAQTYCSGSRTVGGSRKKVSLQQCANIAYGACQNKAKDAATGIMGACTFAFNGYKNCNRQQWSEFWYPEVDELCMMAVASIGY